LLDSSALRLTGGESGNPDGMARLEDYAFGRLTVDGRVLMRDLIVLPDWVVTDWWRARATRW
jgi:hypothetical protein